MARRVHVDNGASEDVCDYDGSLPGEAKDFDAAFPPETDGTSQSTNNEAVVKTIESKARRKPST
jgi:hypothetical protein